MNKKSIIVVVISGVVGIVVLMLTIRLVFDIQEKQHQSVEICRVFRELGHARTIVYLDEIDVQDCPEDFRHAYAAYVLEMRSAGIYASSKKIALAKLQDAARSHGVMFSEKNR